jgi:predicted nucleic acid-binding protein
LKSPLPDAARVILDTNVVLDWLVFDDPGVAAVAQAIEGGAIEWVACPRMRDELERTLGYPALARWAPDCERSLSRFDQHAVVLAPPATLPSLRCSDPDDQVFLDLAAAAGSRWLLTHDRALLRLAKRARAFGLQIVKPQGWQLD